MLLENYAINYNVPCDGQYQPASNLIVLIFPWSSEHQEDFPSFVVVDEVERQVHSDGPKEIHVTERERLQWHFTPHIVAQSHTTSSWNFW